jgi:hypothetical protein
MSMGRGVNPQKPESSPSPLLIGISVLDFAPNIEAPFAIFDGDYFIGRQSWLSLRQDAMIAIWIDNIFWASDSARSRFEGKASGEWGAISFQSSPTTDIIRRSYPTVFDGHLGLEWIGIDINIPDSASPYVGPQLPPRGAHHDPHGGEQSQELKKAYEARNRSDLVTEAPAIKPLILSLIGGTLGFGLCLSGGQYFDDERRILGTLLIGVGALLGGISILSLGFPL